MRNHQKLSTSETFFIFGILLKHAFKGFSTRRKHLLRMKEELVKRLEELVREEMTDDTFAKADEIKNEYLRAFETETHAQLEKFLAEGGQADDFQSPKDDS